MAGALVIAGRGLVPEHLTPETAAALAGCDEIHAALYGDHIRALFQKICPQGVLRSMPRRREEWPRRLAAILRALSAGRTIGYIATGHPMILSGFAQQLAEECRRRKLPHRILPAVSSIDLMLCRVAPEEGRWDGCQVVYLRSGAEPSALWDPARPAFVLGLNEFVLSHKTRELSDFLRRVGRLYAADHPVRLIEAVSTGEGEVTDQRWTMAALSALFDRIRSSRSKAFHGSLYFPPFASPKPARRLPVHR